MVSLKLTCWTSNIFDSLSIVLPLSNFLLPLLAYWTSTVGLVIDHLLVHRLPNGQLLPLTNITCSQPHLEWNSLVYGLMIFQLNWVLVEASFNDFSLVTLRVSSTPLLTHYFPSIDMGQSFSHSILLQCITLTFFTQIIPLLIIWLKVCRFGYSYTLTYLQ